MPMPHLPTVPEKFIQLARTVACPRSIDQNILISMGVHNEYYFNRQVIKDGKLVTSRIQQYGKMSNEWEQWCRKNIFPNFYDTSARISTGTSDTHGAHLDYPGKVRLYYLIDQGDETAETVFYMKPGRPVVHSIQDPEDPDRIVDSHDDLIELERVQFPVKQWILFNGHVLHAVENNSGPRLNLTVDIDPANFSFLIRPQT